MKKTIHRINLWAVALLCLLGTIAKAQSIELTTSTQHSWEVVDNEKPGFYSAADLLAKDGDAIYALYKGSDDQTRVKRYTPNGTGLRTWEQVGGIVAENLTNHYLGIAAANGIVYVAYKDPSAGFKITVKKLDTSVATNNWEVVGTPGISDALNIIDLKLTMQGNTPYVYYQDNGDNYYTSVLKFNGTSWEYVGAKGMGINSAAHSPSLVFMSGVPYIIYRDGGNYLRATARSYNSTTHTWDLVGASTVSPGYSQAVSLAAMGGKLYAAYTEGATSGITFKALNAGVWETLSSNAGTATGAHVNLQGFGTNLFLEYSDGDNSNNITVKRYNGSGWDAINSTGIPAGNVSTVSVECTNSSVFVLFKKNNSTTNNSLYKLEYALGSFGSVNVGDLSAVKTLQVTTRSSGGIVTIIPPAGFEVSTPTSGYVTGVSTAMTDGVAKAISVRAKPTASGMISGYVTFSFAGATTERVFVSANGYKEPATITATASEAPNWENLSSNVQGFSNMAGVLALDGDVLYEAYKGADAKSRIRRYAMDAEGTRLWSDIAAALPADLTYTGLKMVAKDNVLYVAYPDQSLGNKLTVKKINTADAAATWQPVGAAGATSGGVTVDDLVLNGGVLYVLLEENNKTSLLKFNDTDWEYVGAKDLGIVENSYSPSVVFVNAIPYIIYKDGGNALKATVRVLNSATNTWDLVGGATASPAFAQSTAIAAIDSKIYVAYTENYTSAITVKYLNGDTWESFATSPGTATGGHLTLKASGAKLNVLFTESESKLTLKRYTGTAWETVGGGSIPSGNVVWATELSPVFYGETAYVAHATSSTSSQYNLYKLSDLYVPDFGDVILDVTSDYQVFNVVAKNLTGSLKVDASEGYLVSNQIGASFTSGFGLGGPTNFNIQVYVKFKPRTIGHKPGYITISSDGAAPVKVLVSGKGIYPMELTAPAVSEVTANAAKFTASLVTDRGSAVTEKGFVFGTNSNPTIGTAIKLQSATALEAITTTLSPNHKYYVRAYAINSNGTGYSDAVEFTTPKGQATITLSNLGQFYNGGSRSVGVSTNPSGLSVDLVYEQEGVELTGSPINAGTYTVKATIANGEDYTGEKIETFTIYKSIAVIDFGNIYRVYDGTEKQIIPTTTPVGLRVDFVYKKDGVALSSLPVNAGTYTVEANIVDDNYTATKTGSLIIQKATQTVAFDMGVAYEYGYDEVFDPKATASTGEAVTYTIIEGAEFAEVTADNKIRIIGLGIFKVQATQAGTENYETATATRQFKSSKATRFVTFNDQQITYSTSSYKLQPATASPEGTITYVVAEQETEQYPGKVTITDDMVTVIKAGKVKLRAEAADDMYGTDAIDEMELTISKATASISIENLEQQFDGTAKAVTVTTTPGGIIFTVTYNGSEIAPIQPGTYAVVATIQNDNYEGEITGTLTILNSTGLGDEKEQLKMTFFPNPTDRFLHVQLEENADVQIISAIGQVLIQQQVKAGEAVIDVSSLRSGYYILKVSSKQRQVQKKFIKR